MAKTETGKASAEMLTKAELDSLRKAKRGQIEHATKVFRKPATDPPIDGEEGLKRLADLTRRVIAVPKSEVVDPPKQKKRGA